MRTDTLLFTSDLRTALVGIPIDLVPPAVWLDLADGSPPAPAWPLFPEHYARLRMSCLAIEDRWAAGDYPEEKLRVVWQRWEVVEAWALECWGESALMAAYCQGLQAGLLGALPKPPPLFSDPFGVVRQTHSPGVSGAAVRRERQKQRQSTASSRKPAPRRSGASLFD